MTAELLLWKDVANPESYQDHSIVQLVMTGWSRSEACRGPLTQQIRMPDIEMDIFSGLPEG